MAYVPQRGDQIKSLDWRARRAERVAQAPPATLSEVTAKVLTLIESHS